MAHETLFLEIMTPEKNLYSGSVSAVFLPGLDGQLGVLPGHAALITKLGTGMVRCVEVQGQERLFFCSGGFCEIVGDDVRILANIAERSDEIDYERVRRSKERAESRIFSSSSEVNYERAVSSLQRAIQRMQAASKKVV